MNNSMAIDITILENLSAQAKTKAIDGSTQHT